MLVVTRKRDEAIVIGNGIEVRVLRIGPEGVRLGVTAPLAVPVHRREVYDLIKAANVSVATDRDTAGELASRLRRRKTDPPASPT